MNRDWAIYNVNNFQLYYDVNTTSKLGKPFTIHNVGDTVFTFTPFLSGRVLYRAIGITGGHLWDLYEDGVLIQRDAGTNAEINAKAFKKYEVKTREELTLSGSIGLYYDITLKPNVVGLIE